jgi:hypothetical protein
VPFDHAAPVRPIIASTIRNSCVRRGIGEGYAAPRPIFPQYNRSGPIPEEAGGKQRRWS